MDSFAGKVAVITGAGRGIGRGIALRCAKEGMHVVLAGPNFDSLLKTQKDLEVLGASTLVVKTDVSKREEVEHLLQETLQHFEKVHMLVNNAGVGLLKSILESCYQDWDWVVGVNLMGVIYGVKTFLPVMLQQAEECWIVNISSMNGVMAGLPMFASYCATKHAVVALSEALFFELASTPHIHVSVYLPGQVNTDIARCERNYPAAAKEQVLDNPERRARIEDLEKQLARGFSIERSADILFEGLQLNKLYIGPAAFVEQFNQLPIWIKGRAENIVEERSPSRD